MIRIFFLLLLTLTAYAEPLYLKHQLQTAQIGTYVATQQGKNYTLIFIREKNAHSLVIEEVVVPASTFARQRLSWRAWFEEGAPGHSLWTIASLDLSSGRFTYLFSYTHQNWADLDTVDAFFTTLLNLPFTEMPAEQRKRVGLPPGYGKQDTRPLWAPPLHINGQAISPQPFTVYSARWPQDHSELAGRTLDIYIPTSFPEAPLFFPYWVEIEGKMSNTKMRIVDAGHGAYSPRSGFPNQNFP